MASMSSAAERLAVLRQQLQPSGEQQQVHLLVSRNAQQLTWEHLVLPQLNPP